MNFILVLIFSGFALSVIAAFVTNPHLFVVLGDFIWGVWGYGSPLFWIGVFPLTIAFLLLGIYVLLIKLNNMTKVG